MSNTRQRNPKTSQLPTFVHKVVQIVTNPQLNGTVCWTTTRDSFIIKDVPTFTETVLPLYFKHHNFASFIRQLNMYGFKKIRHSDGQNVYYNEYFREGSQHLLKNISRKIKQEKEETLALYNPSFEPKDQNRVTREMHELKLKQSNLQDMCKHFLKQNQKLLQQNQSFLKKMQRETVQKETRIEQFLIELLVKKNAITVNGQNGKMLSLTNEEHPLLQNCMGKEIPLEQNQTPLEVLANILDNNKQIKKMKDLISSSYPNTENITSKKSKTFTIINTINTPRADPYPNHVPEELEEINFFDDYSSVKELSLNLKPSKSQSERFLSVNEFLNAEDYNNYSGVDL